MICRFVSKDRFPVLQPKKVYPRVISPMETKFLGNLLSSFDFRDTIFPTLSGARIVRIATHPGAMKVISLFSV